MSLNLILIINLILALGLLTHREVAARLFDLSFQLAGFGADALRQMRALQGVPDFGVGMVSERVQVETDGPSEQNRVLWSH